MTDEQFTEFLRKAAQGYHRPPETPRDTIWAGIEEARAVAREARPIGSIVPHWVRWGVGIAAALVLGVGIGRQLGPGGGPAQEITPLAEAPSGAVDAVPEGGVVRLVALEHLNRTEGFLTMFRADARLGRRDRDAVAAAREMLTTTRLLQGSSAATDARLKELLDDLELILVQIARLGDEADREETDFITQGIEQRDILLKLRSAASDQAAWAGVQGVL